jgi:hypothetical protein
MDDGVDAVERPPKRLAVSDVADLELDVGREIVGARRVRVDLRRQIVERANAMAAREQLVGEVGADEARTARDENELGRRG